MRRTLIIAVGLLALVVAGCGTTKDTRIEEPKQPAVTSPPVSDAFHFKSFPELVATSDLFIVGTVLGSDLGQCLDCSEGGDHPNRTLEVTVELDEALKGETTADSIVVRTLELDYRMRSRELWRIPGKKVALALMSTTDRTGLYRLSNHEQSVYPVSGDALTAISRDELANEVAKLDLSELRTSVREAQRKSQPIR